MPGIILFLVILALVLIIIGYCIRVIPQSNAYVVERLGAYSHTLDKGMHLILPFVDRVANKVSLKERVQDFAPQPVITKNNVTMQIDTVVYFQITDPVLYTYGIHNPINAIENLTATTLRNIIGDLELDQTLTSRDIINSKMRAILDEATDPWGIRVQRVEVKNIIPPRDIQEAMEKQMRAERERRESILRAEGEAQAMERVFDAQSKGAILLSTIDPDSAYLKLKSFEAFEKAANGQATKIIVPSDLQNLASVLAVGKEIIK